MIVSDLFQHKSAVISTCGSYRYLLRRIWDDRLPPFVSGMLNPSTADAEMDDPTIIRNIRRAQQIGCGSLVVWNLFAFRATDPSVMKAAHDPIGPENDKWIREVLQECRIRGGVAVAGWGTHGSFQDRDRSAARIAEDVGVNLLCLGTTKDGHPRHPLYVSNAQELKPWAPL